MPSAISVIRFIYHSDLLLFFLRTIKKHISAPTAAEPTQESVSVPAPTTDAAAVAEDSLDASVSDDSVLHSQ